MIWRGIFQQFTFRGDNGQLFGERVRYPMNMFLFTIYFLYGLYRLFLSSGVSFALASAFCQKIFFGLPLDENQGDPIL